MPGSGHRNELQLELSGRSPGNATTFRDRAGLEAFLNHGFAVRALLLASGRSGVNPVVESLATIIEISQSVIRPSASAAIVAHRSAREEHPDQRKCGSCDEKVVFYSVRSALE